MDSAAGANTISDGGGQTVAWPTKPPPDFVFGSFPPKVVEPAKLLSNLPDENDQDHGLREVVRFFQCCKCSKLFRKPVTLWCGHSFCQDCLEPRQRKEPPPENVSPQHNMEVPCPLCGRTTPSWLLRPDVTFRKIMSLVRDVLAKAILQRLPDTPITLKEEAMDGGPPAIASDPFVYPSGSRLLATLAMAEKGLLRYPSTVVYEEQPRHGNDGLDSILLDRLTLPLRTELDCTICHHIIVQPTTLSCGHTFCRHCILRASDKKGSCRCPVCREPIRFLNKYKGLPTNEWLVPLVHSLYPEEVAERRLIIREEEQPGVGHMTTPIFVCTALLPTIPCPLQIFEEKYRLMLRRCIEYGDRTFGMVMSNVHKRQQGHLGVADFVAYGTIMEIVAYEYKEDGRSIIQTRGLHRFRIIDHGMRDGYRVAHTLRMDDMPLAEEYRAEQLDIAMAMPLRAANPSNGQALPYTYSVELSSCTTVELYYRLRALVNELQARVNAETRERTLRIYGECPDDLATISYWVAAAACVPCDQRYHMLVTFSVRERLKLACLYLLDLLRELGPEREQNNCNIL